MGWLRHFEVSGSPDRRRRIYRPAFLLSFIFTVDLFLTNKQYAAEWSSRLPVPAHFLLLVLQLTGLFAALILWLGMIVDVRSQRTSLARLGWMAALFLGNVWAAEVYYLFLYPHTGRKTTDETARPAIAE
jgi:hypothetical protein